MVWEKEIPGRKRGLRGIRKGDLGKSRGEKESGNGVPGRNSRGKTRRDLVFSEKILPSGQAGDAPGPLFPGRKRPGLLLPPPSESPGAFSSFRRGPCPFPPPVRLARGPGVFPSAKPLPAWRAPFLLLSRVFSLLEKFSPGASGKASGTLETRFLSGNSVSLCFSLFLSVVPCPVPGQGSARGSVFFPYGVRPPSPAASMRRPSGASWARLGLRLPLGRGTGWEEKGGEQKRRKDGKRKQGEDG